MKRLALFLMVITLCFGCGESKKEKPQKPVQTGPGQL
jgi:hypothetical protein